MLSMAARQRNVVCWLPPGTVRACCFACALQTGIFFAVLPGTILGFTNLLLITAHHGLNGLSPAWIQAHGHSQVLSWIGGFVLGIGFYSQPLIRANRCRLPIVCWALWATGCFSSPSYSTCSASFWAWPG